MLNKSAIAAALAVLSIPFAVSAQVLGTGAYPFASFDNRGFDSVNLGNLNTRFSIPIVQKTGRGLPFNYVIQYEGLVWTPVPVTGSTTSSWVPSTSWGFTGALDGTGFVGYMTYSSRSATCGSGSGQRSGRPTWQIYSKYVYYDAFGAAHPFTYQYTSECSDGSGGNTSSGSTIASDGSGYTLVNNETQIQARNGTIITPAPAPNSPSATSATDSNGNKISFGGSNGVFTDTLGTTALTVSGSSPVVFTYPVVNQSGGATTAQAKLYYLPYTVSTNFGCSGIVEYGATSVNLVDHITLADNVTTYSFTYEPSTPGATTVTGRLHSITLPGGGTITYNYSGGCNSTAGIMADGTTAGLSRTTSDSSNARTYTRATINANATSTTLQDEKGNQTFLHFTDVGGDYYETHRQAYQGATTGTLLLERLTCYNSSGPCDGNAIGTPITTEQVSEQYNGGSYGFVNYTFDTYGNVLSTSISSATSLLESTTNTYNSLSELTSSTTKDGSGNFVSEVSYGYDQTTPTATSGLPQHVAVSGTRGNQTSSNVFYTSTSAISSSTAYYDTGMPVSTTSPNGTTSYGYDSTQTFVTQTTLPTPSSGVSLSTVANYDAASGAILNATGMNSGQTTTVNLYDPRLRPTTETLPNSGKIVITYTPTQANVTQNLNLSTGQNAAGSVLYDGYGRQSRTEVLNGQSANGYYQADTCYDASGFVGFASTPYQSTGFNVAAHCSGAGTSYIRDALGRPTSITTADGTATIQYTNRAVETTDVNGVQKITQYDVLGRITGVCEITSTALNGQSPTACGMDISGTGFATSYAYALATHTTTVTQGVQTRTFVTDALGRTTSVTEPERGTTTYAYTYNGQGLSVVRSRPKVNQSSPTVQTQTTTQYDSVGRVVSINYSDGTAVAKNYYYDVLPPNQGWSQTPANPKGMLVATSSGVSGTSLARSEFSYDLMGNVTTMWECGPSICGGASQSSRSLQFAYDLGNNLTSEGDPVSGTIAYGRSPVGEVTSIVNGTYALSNNTGTANLVSNVVNGPFGPSLYTLGNGLNTVLTYDSLGRNNGGWVCSGSTTSGCTGGVQLYGNSVNLSGGRVTSDCDTVLNQCESNTYDGMNRLTALNGSANSFTYTYDRWGNRLSQTATLGSGSSPSGAVNQANNQLSSVAYDAAGNQEGDGISHTFTYDAEDNVTAVDNGSTATYTYDALNHRVRGVTSAGAYEYAFDAQGRRISTWQTASNFGVEGRVYWDGKQITFRNGPTYFEHQSYLGTERLRTNYQGSTAARETSLAYGDDFNQAVLISGADQDNRQFAGQEYDSESSSQHAQFRQYSSTQGRWMSADPYDGSYDATNPQSFNRYSYVGNTPLIYTDPLGLTETCNSEGCIGTPCDASGGNCGTVDTVCGNCEDGYNVYADGEGYAPTPNGSGGYYLSISSSGASYFGGQGGIGGAPSNPPCSQLSGALAIPARLESSISAWSGKGVIMGGTVSAAGGGFGGSVTGALVSDTSGNVGLEFTVQGGMAGVTSVGKLGISFSGGGVLGYSTFSSLSGYSGVSQEASASYGSGLAGGGTYAYNSSGHSVTGMLGYGAGASISAGPSYTWVTPVCHR